MNHEELTSWSSMLETIQSEVQSERKQLPAHVKGTAPSRRRALLDASEAAVTVGLRGIVKNPGDYPARLEAALGREPSVQEASLGLAEVRQLLAASEPERRTVSRNLRGEQAAVLDLVAGHVGVTPSAMLDIRSRATEAWGDETPDRVEATEWLVGIRTEAPHLFVRSTGAGSLGSRGGGQVARAPMTARQYIDEHDGRA